MVDRINLTTPELVRPPVQFGSVRLGSIRVKLPGKWVLANRTARRSAWYSSTPAQMTSGRAQSFELQQIDRGKLYELIVNQVLEGIRSGAFPPGAALPPERLLATRFAVSRSSVREAVRVLEHAGVVDVRTGSGTYITNEALSKSTLVRVKAVEVGEHSPLDVIVVRRALEPVSAALAARNRSHRDLSALGAANDEYSRSVTAAEDPTEADIRFHNAIGAASRNSLLQALIEHTVEVMREPFWRSVALRSLKDSARALRSMKQHRRILESIRAADETAAIKAMNEHLESVEAKLNANT
jgi:GntR family transcriptional regulator, transcriptional repressor for pyruvate dehydrogenase complex